MGHIPTLPVAEKGEKNDLHYRAQLLRSALYRQPQLAGGLISVDGSSKAVPDGEPRARNSLWMADGRCSSQTWHAHWAPLPSFILYSSSAFASEACETSFRSLFACVFWSGRQERWFWAGAE